MDLTTDVVLIERCIKTEDATKCDAGCKWTHGTNGDNTTPTEEPKEPMFTEAFCHPAEVKSTMWKTCLENTGSLDSCTKIPECIWSDGKELIPDHDFCAPTDVDKTQIDTLIQSVEKCVLVDTATGCNDGCQWRHGKTPTDTTMPGQN